MATIKLKGVPPYDGEYQIPSVFTNKENHRIKQISGVRAGEVQEALAAGDTDVVVAISVVVLERQGIQVNESLLWEANIIDNFDFTADEAAEDDGRPPATATTGGSENESAVVGSENGNEHSSGRSGTAAGEDSPSSPAATGSPGSETFVDSDPVTSEN